MYNTVYFRVLILFLTGPLSLKYNYLSISLMSSIKNRTSRLCILCLFCIYFLQRLKRQAETRLSQRTALLLLRDYDTYSVAN